MLLIVSRLSAVQVGWILHLIDIRHDLPLLFGYDLLLLA